MSNAKTTQEAILQTIDRGWSLVTRVRLRAVLYTAGIVLATWAAIILMSAAWVPVVGVAAVAVAMSVNKVTQVFKRPVCYNCGCDLSNLPPTAYGIACPTCGSLNLHLRPGDAPRLPTDDKLA